MFHHYQRHHQFFCDKEMNEMYLSVFLMNLAESMISIFVPIYLYTLHYSIAEILLFFLISQAGSLLFALPAARIVAKVGAKHSVLISTFFLVIYYFGLNYLKVDPYLFYILPLGVTFRALFYNFGFELNYLDHCDRKKVGRDLSLFAILSFAATVLAPLIGGFIITYLGFGLMFFVGSGLLILSVVPLFLSIDQYRRFDFTARDLLRLAALKDNVGMALSFVGYAVESNIGRVVWPVFLIIILVTEKNVGYVSSLAAILTIFIVYLVGRLSDHNKTSQLLRWGTILYFFGWLGCLFADTALKVFAINSFKDVSQRILLLPWDSAFYKKVQLDNYFRLVVLRDMIFNFSRVLVMPFIILLFLFDSSAIAFKLVFFVAAIFSLLYPLIQKFSSKNYFQLSS